MNARSVIIRPVVSEKSYALLAANKYTFRVHERANKTQVRQAVEEIFGVRVAGRAHRCGSSPSRSAAASRAGRTAPVEEGDRDAPPRGHDRAVRGTGDRSLMAIKKHKPTSARPPLRDLAPARGGHQEASPRSRSSRACKKSGGRNANGRVTSRHRGGGAKRRYRKIDFKRRKDGVPAKVAAIEYDPNRTRAHRPAPLRGRREALHPGARRGCASATRSRPARRADIAPGNALPLSAHPDRHDRPQRGADARPRRPARPRRRHRDPAGREGGRLRDAAPALGRDADGARSTAAPRSARSATPSTSSSTSARPAARATAASARRRAAWR